MTIEDKLKVVCIVLSLFITVLYIIQISKLEEEKDRAKQAEERLSKSIEQNRKDKNDDAEDARRYRSCSTGLHFISSNKSECINAIMDVRKDCATKSCKEECKYCKYYYSFDCSADKIVAELEKRGLLK